MRVDYYECDKCKARMAIHTRCNPVDVMVEMSSHVFLRKRSTKYICAECLQEFILAVELAWEKLMAFEKECDDT